MTRYAANKLLIAIILPAIVLMFWRVEVEAIPVFARKHKTSCLTCHEVFPKLNPFGESYRRRGYQFPKNDYNYVKEKPLKLGADAWKKVWPDGVWPGDMPGTPPISLKANFFYRYKSNAPIKHDFTFPDEIKLLSGGTMGDDISFFADLTMIESGSEFGGVERVFIRFNNLLGENSSNNRINIIIGQFEPAFVLLPNHRRLTYTPYLSNIFQVGENNFQFKNHRGFEATGMFRSRFDYAVGVINGNGTGTGRSDDSGNSSDNNSMKDIYTYVGYKLGGLALDGSGLTEEEVPYMERKEKSIHIKGFAYVGGNRLDIQQKVNDRFNRYGLGIDLRYNNLNLLGFLSAGSHENPNNDSRKYNVFSYTVETDFAIYPWLIGIIRYENVDLDYSPVKDKVVLAVATLVRANLKLTIESSLQTRGGDGDTGLVRLDIAF